MGIFLKPNNSQHWFCYIPEFWKLFHNYVRPVILNKPIWSKEEKAPAFLKLFIVPNLPIFASDLCWLQLLLQWRSESAHLRTFGTPDCSDVQHEYLIHCQSSRCIKWRRKKKHPPAKKTHWTLNEEPILVAQGLGSCVRVTWSILVASHLRLPF